MERQSPADVVHAPDETETIDLTTLLTEDFFSLERARPTDIRVSLLGKLLEALPLPALLLERSGLITFANKACARINEEYGIILGKPFSKLFSSGKSQARAVVLLEEIFTTRRPHTGEALLDIRGSRIWARMSFRSVRIGSDRAALVLVEDLTHDKAQLSTERKLNEQLRQEIARRKAIEKTLRDSEQKCESAMEGAEVSLWDWNIMSGSLVCDDRFSQILGYSPGEIQPLGASWWELVHPADLPLFRQSIKHHFAGLSEYLDVELRARCKSGEWKWVLTRGKVAERDQEDKPLRLVGTILDITEHKKNQERIRSLTQALIKAQETERRKLALDLHDEVAQQLSAFTFFLESVRQEVSPSQPETRQEIAKISGLAQQLVEYVRGMAYALRPPMLDKLGLVPTLSQYCCEYSKTNGIKIDFFPLGMKGVALDFDTEINLFRITQEALTNVRKHAAARRVTMKLQAALPNIILSIEDDGSGFDVRKQMRDSGQRKMGLSGMEQRASLLGGRLSIQSGSGKGSRISIEVPLRVNTNEDKEENTHR